MDYNLVPHFPQKGVPSAAGAPHLGQVIESDANSSNALTFTFFPKIAIAAKPTNTTEITRP